MTHDRNSINALAGCTTAKQKHPLQQTSKMRLFFAYALAKTSSFSLLQEKQSEGMTEQTSTSSQKIRPALLWLTDDSTT